jgi:hypothetical protein
MFPRFVHEQRGGGLRRDAQLLLPRTDVKSRSKRMKWPQFATFWVFGQSGVGGAARQSAQT